MSDIWNTKPAVWKAMSLNDRMEALRKWYCTGPCGQGVRQQGTRAALDMTLREANANLIAASPELLEACKAALEANKYRSNGYVKQLSDAIEKAEQREPRQDFPKTEEP